METKLYSDQDLCASPSICTYHDPIMYSWKPPATSEDYNRYVIMIYTNDQISSNCQTSSDVRTVCICHYFVLESARGRFVCGRQIGRGISYPPNQRNAWNSVSAQRLHTCSHMFTPAHQVASGLVYNTQEISRVKSRRIWEPKLNWGQVRLEESSPQSETAESMCFGDVKYGQNMSQNDVNEIQRNSTKNFVNKTVDTSWMFMAHIMHI